MPETDDHRLAFENDFKASILEGFREADDRQLSGSDLAAVVTSSVEPDLVERHQYSAILLMLYFMTLEDDLQDRWQSIEDEESRFRKRLDLRAERSGQRHAKRLGRQVAKGTRFWRGRRPDDIDPREWETDHVFGDERAETIAITETTRAESYGEDIAARYANHEGYELKSIWRVVRDEKLCPICRKLNGKGYDVWGKLYPDGAPAHIRCRCWREWFLSFVGGRP